MAARPRRLLVATDLDATLLDHQTYSYTAALPALKQLKSLACPVIFNSSKTQAEQVRLRQDIGLQAPFIIENGAAVIIPAGQLGRTTDDTQVFGPPYAELTAQISKIRRGAGYRFRGFTDLSVADITELTGLSPADAAAAQQRSGSEPLYWEDTEPAFEAFKSEVTQLGLQTTQGGRFRHVMSQTDKGKALNWLVQQYRQYAPNIDWCVVALGDSPNDLPMLRAADIGVHIPNPHRKPFELSGIHRLITAPAPGPTGWTAAIQDILFTEQLLLA